MKFSVPYYWGHKIDAAQERGTVEVQAKSPECARCIALAKVQAQYPQFTVSVGEPREVGI